MADLEKLNQVQLERALSGTEPLSRGHLRSEELEHLGLLLNQMQVRYPSQDQEETTEGFLADFEQLALRYSLREVREALAELRIKPGQKFFPRPDEVAEEIVLLRERRTQEALRSGGWAREWREHMRAIEAERATPEYQEWLASLGKPVAKVTVLTGRKRAARKRA
jgi:hypothetical protein